MTFHVIFYWFTIDLFRWKVYEHHHSTELHLRVTLQHMTFCSFSAITWRKLTLTPTRPHTQLGHLMPPPENLIFYWGILSEESETVETDRARGHRRTVRRLCVQVCVRSRLDNCTGRFLWHWYEAWPATWRRVSVCSWSDDVNTHTHTHLPTLQYITVTGDGVVAQGVGRRTTITDRSRFDSLSGTAA